MIKIGINNNVVLTKVSRDEKMVLAVTFKESGEKQDDLFAMFESGEETNMSEGTTIRIWPIDNKKPDGSGETMDADGMIKRINTEKDVLSHILKGYMISGDIKWDLFTGTGIVGGDVASLRERIVQSSVVEKIWDNLTSQFVAYVQKLEAEGRLSEPMRLLLVRQSKAKAYSAFRKNFIKDNPFFEPMSIPAENSNLKFTKYEKDNGLDSDEVVAKSEADSTPVEEVEENDIFGLRA